MSLPRPVKAVIFDMDGLLVDTETAYFAGMQAAGAELGVEVSLALFKTMVGLPGPMSDQRVLDHYGRDFPVETFNRRVVEHVSATIEAGIALKAGVIELLDHLDAVALPRAIATSSSHRAVESHLGWSGILPRFHAIIARGDYVNGKPNPDPYLKAAERLGMPPADCLALEDSHNGVRAAAAAGMMTIMVPDMLEPTEEMHGLCIRIAQDLHEVHGLLRDHPPSSSPGLSG